jgi:hypothetical protein
METLGAGGSGGEASSVGAKGGGAVCCVSDWRLGEVNVRTGLSVQCCCGASNVHKRGVGGLNCIILE